LGKNPARVSVISLLIGLWRCESQTLNNYRPPPTSTRCLTTPLILVREEHDAELTDNCTEAGIVNGRAVASAGRNSTISSARNFPLATSSIGGFRSVAVRCVSRGNTSRRRRVTIPVPAASSRIHKGSRGRGAPGNIVREVSETDRAKTVIVKDRDAAREISGSIAHHPSLV
jgi:hypothetical protein